MSEDLKPSFGSSPIALLLMSASVGFYLGAASGWLAGLTAGLVFVVSVAVANLALVARGLRLSATTRARWILYALFMAGIAMLRAQACDTGGACRSIFA